MKNKTSSNKPCKVNIPIERLKNLFEALKNGMPLAYACDLTGVPFQLIQKWQNLYDDYLVKEKEKTDYSKIDPPYDIAGNLILTKLTTINIVSAIKKTRAEHLLTLTQKLKESKDWQRFAWLIERRYGDAYNKLSPSLDKNEKIDGIKIEFVSPETDAERLERIENEAKETIGANND